MDKQTKRALKYSLKRINLVCDHVHQTRDTRDDLSRDDHWDLTNVLGDLDRAATTIEALLTRDKYAS